MTTENSRADALTDAQRRTLQSALDLFVSMGHAPGSDHVRTLAGMLATRPVDQHEAAAADDREPVDEVLEIVASYGPYGRDINEGLRFQIVLADEVKRLRSLHEFYVSGAQARAASANEEKQK